MSWHYSQALVAAYSAANSSDGAPSALLSGSPTQQAYLSPDRMKAFSRLSQFGMTFAPLTESLGEAVLTWCLEASPVKISAQLVKARELTEHAAECGRTWPESFTKWDLATSLWKTPPLLTRRGLNRVLGDLASMGYDARWGVLGAVDAGAPHKRDRIWIVAHADGLRLKGHELFFPNLSSRPSENVADAMRQRNWGKAGKPDGADEEIRSDGIGSSHEAINQSADVADADCSQCEGARLSSGGNSPHSESLPSSAWWRQDPAEAPESNVGRMADGVAARVDRLKAIGNGQVPIVAALAWRILSKKDLISDKITN